MADTPDVPEQGRLVAAVLSKHETLTPGQACALIDTTWWLTWEAHTKGLHTAIQPVDNTGLLRRGELKPASELREGRDFTIIPKPAWDMIALWYGGGPSIIRNVMRRRGGPPVVELYRLHVRVHAHSPKRTVEDPPVATFTMSHYTCLSSALKRIVYAGSLTRPSAQQLEDLSNDDISPPRLSKLFQVTAWSKEDGWLPHLGRDLDLCVLAHGWNLVQDVMVELADEHGTLPSTRATSAATNGTANGHKVPPAWPLRRLDDTLTEANAKKLQLLHRGAGGTNGVQPPSAAAVTPSAAIRGFARRASSLPAAAAPGAASRTPLPLSAAGQAAVARACAPARPVLPGRLPSSRSHITPAKFRDFARDAPPPARPPGVVGLHNVGNTCFMNSALQCLSKTMELTQYFQSGEYRPAINRTNPLGCGGRLAEAYADLIQAMWRGDRSAVEPSRFKATISRFAPQFVGFQQHDSQELLAYLLDGLHEDLNKVIDKPMTETAEGDGAKPDGEVAAEAWRRHLLRNQSRIVDLFVGQYKSHVQCPTCNRSSITFDPFMYLSVPLPPQPASPVSIIIITRESVSPLAMKLRPTGSADDVDVLDAVSKAVDIPADRLVAYQLLHMKLTTILQPPVRLCDVSRATFGRPDVFSACIMEMPCASLARAAAETRLNPLHVALPKAAPQLAMMGLEVQSLVDSAALTYPRHVFVQTAPHDGGAANGAAPVYGPRKAAVTHQALQRAVWCTMRRAVAQFCGVDAPAHRMPSMEQLPYTAYVASAFRRGHLDPITGSASDVVTLTDRFQIFVVVRWRPGVDVYYKVQRLAPPAELRGGGMPDNSLQGCLELWSQREQLNADNTWYCNQCRDHQQAYKQLSLWRTPEVLIIHLKRFRQQGHFRERINTLIDFPVTGLDIEPLLAPAAPRSDGCVYDLFGVSNHHGGLGGGHYTAYALVGDSWYNFDDSRTSPAFESSLVTSSAYLLFYRRRGAAGLAPPPKAKHRRTMIGPELPPALAAARRASTPAAATAGAVVDGSSSDGNGHSDVGVGGGSGLTAGAGAGAGAAHLPANGFHTTPSLWLPGTVAGADTGAGAGAGVAGARFGDTARHASGEEPAGDSHKARAWRPVDAGLPPPAAVKELEKCFRSRRTYGSSHVTMHTSSRHGLK